MTDGVETLTLEHLQVLRSGINHLQTGINDLKGDMIEVKERLGLLEGISASMSRRVDRVGGDVEQIKRRLSLAEA